MTAQEILTRWGQYFAQSQFYTDPIVNISWWIIYLLKDLVDAANYLLQTIYKMSDFIFTDTVADFLRSFNSVLWIPFAISLIALAYTLFFHKSDTRPKVAENLLIAIAVICALPTMMLSVKDMTFAGIDMVNNYSISEGTENGDSNTSYGEKIIIDNLVDLKYMETNGWDETLLSRKTNNLTSIDSVDITERLWADKVKSTDDVFDKYLKYDENGNVSVEKIDRSSWIWLLSPVYYRYNFNFISMFLSLLASVIALFFTAYKVARLIMEIAIHQFLAVFSAASDLTVGQRTKQILRSIVNCFIVLFLTSILLQFFQLGVQYINHQNINGLVRGFILLFWALTCVDAPNIIERILGIDAGISSGFRTFFGVTHAARTAVGIGKGFGNTAKKAGRAYTAAAGRSGMFREHYQKWSTRNKNNSGSNGTNENGYVNGFNASSGTENQTSNNEPNTPYKKNAEGKQNTVTGFMGANNRANGNENNSKRGVFGNRTGKNTQNQGSNSVSGYQVSGQSKPYQSRKYTTSQGSNHVFGKDKSYNPINSGGTINRRNNGKIQNPEKKGNGEKKKNPFEPDNNNLKNPPK